MMNEVSEQQIRYPVNQLGTSNVKQQITYQVSNPPTRQEEWVICPACHNKTRTRVRADTVLLNFPLYCPKCKQEHLINAKQLHISVITEPDAQMQSR